MSQTSLPVATSGASGGTPALTLSTANTAGAASTFIRTDDTILAFDATSPTTQAFGDAAATGSATVAARRDHKHAMPAAPTTVATDTIWDAAGDIVRGTGADAAGRLAITVPAANILNVLGVVNGETTVSWKSVHDGTAPAAIGASAAGTSLLSAHRDHVHAITTSEAFITAETTLSATTYADITGATITPAAGTWLVFGVVTGRVVNAHALMHVAITNASNTVLAEVSQAIPASGTASVNSLGNASLSCIVALDGSTAVKLRGARGNTTLTTSWIAVDGNGVGVTNNASSNTNLGTCIRAIKVG